MSLELINTVGILVKNRIVDMSLFLDRYCGKIAAAWQRLEKVTALAREAA